MRRFQWNPAKAALNVRKHGVSFEEARLVFDDACAMVSYDAEHSDREDRFLVLGLSGKLRLLVAAYSEPGENVVRIIMARKATAAEETEYEENFRKRQ